MSARLLSMLLVALGTALLPFADALAQAHRDPGHLQLSEHAESDQATFDALQRRLDNLAPLKSSANPWDIYNLAKAQAWLDFAFDSRAQHDTSGVTRDAFQESELMTAQLEAGAGNISLETPLITSSARLRDDIWQKAEEMKKHQGLRCAAARIAQFEVQLVQAGHAYKELGWRHSKPYVQAVERLAKDAEARLAACPPPVTTAEELPPEVANEPPHRQVLSLAKRVHFAYRLAQIGYATAQVLEQVSYVLRTNPDLTVELRGHADRRGSRRYNLKLSRERAEAVKGYLVNSGVVEKRITVSALGKAEPLAQGQTVLDYARNRRVDFMISSTAEVTLSPRDEDLQIERQSRQAK
jgi:OOP family OmpA-OmpF porin